MPDDNSSSSGSSGSSKKSARKDTLTAFGKSMSRSSQQMMSDAGRMASEGSQAETQRSKDQADRELERAANAPSYKRGGMVRKTGLARVHRGEYVVPRSKVRKLKRIKSGRY